MNDVYQVTNDVSRTRFGFRGSAKIDSDLSAGYRIEIGVRTANSAAVSQFVGPFDTAIEVDPVTGLSSEVDDPNFNPNDDAGNGLDLRHAFWYIQSQHWGTITVGQTDTPSSSTFALTLANIPMMEGDPSGMGAGFFLRATDGTLVDATWSDLMHPTQGSLSRRNEVMYTTPTWNGFQSQMAWGEDDFWAVSLAWAGEHHGFRIATKIAYADMSDPTFSACESEGGALPSNQTSVDCNHWVWGGSVMHVATGLFVSGGYVSFTDDVRQDLDPDLDDNDQAWWIHAGIEQKWHSFGKTTLYGEYGEQENGNTGFDGVTMSFWGLGAVQNIEAAAMDLYLFYRQLNADVLVEDLPIDDFHMVGVGAIIRF
jgi:predicted porin